MTNKDFILKLIKYCCFGFLLFAVFVLSFGCGFYYRDSGHTMQVNAQSFNIQPADTVVSYDLFTTNNILVPVGLCNSTSLDTLINKYGFLGFQFRIFSDGQNLSCSYKLNSLFFSNVNVNADDLLYVDIHNSNDFVDFNMSYNTWVYNYFRVYPSTASQGLSFDPNDINTFPDIIASPSYYFPILCNCPSGFVSNVVSYSISYSYGIAGRYQGVNITFYDVNGRTFLIQLPCLTTSIVNNILEGMVPSRTIFLQQDLSDNSYYNTGFDNGYNAGIAEGRDVGYDIGYNVGFGNGDLVGYQRGIQDTSQYTFLNLIGAVIDAPITAFVNLLDFNVFGFNMLNLCCSLLTLSLIILVVKFVLFRS